MSHPSSAPRFVVHDFLSLLLCCFLGTNLWAQTPKQTPRVSPLEITDREQIIAYWTTETGWKSELQLRNNLAAEDLTVTPVLRLPDGAETALAAVVVKPQEVKAVDLDAAIAAAQAPQLVGTYGSVVLRSRSPSDANLYASIMIRRVGHAVAFHVDGVGESQAVQVGSREGVWWLPNDTASDF